MAKRNSKRRSNKNNKVKGNRQNKTTKSSLENEKKNQAKSSFEEIAEIFWGNNTGEDLYGKNTYDTAEDTNENTKETSETNVDEGDVGATSNSTDSTTNSNADSTTNTNTNTTANDAINTQQQEILNRLKNLNDAVAAITLTRDNVASLRIEVLSNIYFTRELRPMIDAVNLLAFASSNMSTVANNINANSSGDKKEVKDAFKLCYKMNSEIQDMLSTLTRRIKLYVAQLDDMDKNCPPFTFDKDS